MRLENLGLSTAKVNQLKNKGIESVEELVNFLPRKYMDFMEQRAFNQGDGSFQLMGGCILGVTVKGKNLTVKLRDEMSTEIGYVIFFGHAFLEKKMDLGENLYVGGKVSRMHGRHFITPMVWSKEKSDIEGIRPVYPKVKGMAEDYFKNTMQNALSAISKDDYLDSDLLDRFDLMPYHKAVRWVHQPTSKRQLEDGLNRHLFNELFLYNFHLLSRTQDRMDTSPFQLKDLSKTTEFLKRLPFQLTDGQRDVLRGISRKMKDGELVDALVMGDVGCGKTMVALLLMLGQAENGYQSVLVAPTNVLAIQHFHEAKALLEPLGITVAFLNGGVKVRERKQTLKGLEDGTIDVLIGTHACMGKDVKFKNLAIAVVDEEHRFGVKQREAIREKVANGIHMVSMSATPIPRSLAVTLYGEHVSIHTIKSMPNGRKPVEVILNADAVLPYDAIEHSLKRGEQAYIVCPLIEESENDALKEVKSVEEVYAEVANRFTKEGYVVGFISGNMKEDEVAEHLRAFAENQTHVLVSTTIIEVGVNVPNATTMVIQNAERFGSSQLWQLKGRVGRGNKPSVCHLISANPNPLSQEKLEMICRAKDGFEVAREDLRLRGAGSLLGDQQSGDNRYIQLMLQHGTLNDNIRTAVKEILADARRKKRYQMVLQPDQDVVEV